MSTYSYLFSPNPNVDFSRNRILTFKETLTIILGMAGGSLNRELYMTKPFLWQIEDMNV